MRKRDFLLSAAWLPCVLLGCVHFGSSPSSGIDWPEDQELPSFAEPRHLDVADLLESPGDVRMLLATLQGIVNRTEPRIYLFENQVEGKYTWLRDLKVPYTEHGDPLTLVEKYHDEVNGVIIFDPALPASINVATTLAGLRDSLVASPELAELLQEAPYRLPVVSDLRGQFRDSLDAYTWQFDNLWEETTHRMLVGLSPAVAIAGASALPEGFQVVARDEEKVMDASNQRVYELDLSGALEGESVYLRFDDAFPSDGWGPAVRHVSVTADGEEIANFSPGTVAEEPFLYSSHNSKIADGQRFADNNASFIYRFSPPPGTRELIASVEMSNQFLVSMGAEEPDASQRWRAYGFLRDYAVANRAMVFWLDANEPRERELYEKIMGDVEPGTPYLGWFADDIEGEFGGVEFTSMNSVYVVPSDWFSNLTVFAGTRYEPTEQPAAPTPTLENKIYVTYTFGEGDNFQYNQHRMRDMWEDPARGEIPLNWTSSPLLIDGAPAILNHYQQTATENDLLVSGPSGVGYFYPHPWPDDTFPNFLQSTYSYVERSGMTIPYVLSRADHENLPLSDREAAAYRDEHHAPGVFLGWETEFGLEIVNELPVASMRGVHAVAQGREVLLAARDTWDGNSPLFLAVGLLAWNLMPSDIVEINESLGDEFEIVRADQFFALIREAHELPGTDPEVRIPDPDQ